MKEIKDDTDEELYQVPGLEDSIQWKWLYYPKQSTDLMQTINIKLSVIFYTELKKIIS